MTRTRSRVGALVAAMLLLGGDVATGAEIREYSLRLAVDVTGGARATLALVAVIDQGTLVVPLAYADGRDLRVLRAPDGSVISLTTEGGRGVLVATAPAVQAAQTIVVEFLVPGVMTAAPAGAHRIISHALLNTQSTVVDRYVVSVVFPDGWRAHAIRGGAPRVRLESISNAAGARFEVGALTQGDVATMRIEMVTRHRSWGWLVIGLLLAGGYLISFRDLVMPAQR